MYQPNLNSRFIFSCCFTAILLACCFASKAQSVDSVIFSPRDSFPIPRKKLLSLKPTGDFDQRFSFIENLGVSIWGYRVGALVNDAYKVGIGGYFLKQELERDNTEEGVGPNKLSKRVYFGTIYYEPFLFRKKRWEMSMVFELGYGQAVFDSTNKTGTHSIYKREKQNFVPAGIGYSANFIMPDFKGFHFLTYLGLNGMIGLRKAIFISDLKSNFDGWYWSIGSAIFIDKIFADITSKSKKKFKAD